MRPPSTSVSRLVSSWCRFPATTAPATTVPVRLENLLPLHSLEVLVEHTRQARAIRTPMLAGRRLLQSLNPVAVELVHCRVDAVAQQPAVAERAAVAERRARRAFGEPGVPSQQRLESLHPREVLLEQRDGRSADMQQSIAVVVQLQRQLRLSSRRDLTIEP